MPLLSLINIQSSTITLAAYSILTLLLLYWNVQLSIFNLQAYTNILAVVSVILRFAQWRQYFYRGGLAISCQTHNWCCDSKYLFNISCVVSFHEHHGYVFLLVYCCTDAIKVVWEFHIADNHHPQHCMWYLGSVLHSRSLPRQKRWDRTLLWGRMRKG